MDALAHLIEGYTSRGANPLTDVLAREGMRLVFENLSGAVESGDDCEVREKMCRASLLGGILIANAGLGLVHGISSFLGSIGGVPHGTACGILLPYVMEFNLPVCRGKYAEIGGLPEGRGRGRGAKGRAEAAVGKVKELVGKTGITGKLRDAGVKEKDLSFIARESLTSNSTKKNPRTAEYEDILGILKKAF
jgi:alcohol dehydrogenase class IV